MKSIDCDSVLEQLSDFIDADAREELCQAIVEHMSHCHDCQIQVDTVKRTIVLYQNNGGKFMELPMRATARLTAALKAEYTAEPRAD